MNDPESQAINTTSTKRDETILVTARQLAAHLSVHPRTIYRWTRQGRLPLVRLGARTIRYDLEAVRAVLDGGTL